MKKFKNSFRAGACIVVTLTALNLFSPGIVDAVPITSLPDLSLLTPYATFGNYFNDSNVTINGDAGISNNGELQLFAPSTITGDLYLGMGATKTGPGGVGGTLYTGMNFTAAQAQVFTAANALRGLTPDYIYSSLSSGLTISGNGAVTVVNVTGDVDLSSGGNIIFSGGAGDYFVLNILGDLDMDGSAIIAGSGVDASHILINLYSSGNLGNIAHVDNEINGTLLVPYATYAELHSLNGAIYAGDGEIKLMSGARVESVPFTAVPEPSSMLLLGSGLIGLIAYRRKSFFSET